MTLARFIKSAVNPEDYPAADRPEIGIVGRSNAGKSSLLNAMCGGKKVAKISGTPGKTRLLNFFDVGEHYRIVDLPGYGYAARDRKERELWGSMVQTFLEQRASLRGLILVCDIRREWTVDEKMIIDLAQFKNLQVLCVLTKIDKLNRGESLKKFDGWVRTSGKEKLFFHPVSALNNDGVRELEDFVFTNWIQPQRSSG